MPNRIVYLFVILNFPLGGLRLKNVRPYVVFLSEFIHPVVINACLRLIQCESIILGLANIKLARGIFGDDKLVKAVLQPSLVNKCSLKIDLHYMVKISVGSTEPTFPTLSIKILNRA